MRKPLLPTLAFFISSIVVVSCQKESSMVVDTETISSRINPKKAVVSVRVSDVISGDFNREVISNGKVYASGKAEIRFPLSGKIEAVLVRNGEPVRKGQVLAVLESGELKRRLQINKELLEKAAVELDDRLIDYGYRLKDSLNVPPDLMRMALIRSGYNSALYDYQESRSLLAKSRITAPFSGKIANLQARPHNPSELYKSLCTLIDDSYLQVEFSVLESEYGFIRKGTPIELAHFGQASTPVAGVVSEVNPLIDENGMIRIIGKVPNTGGMLLDGMSVRIIVKNQVPDRLFIPKEAVVHRQDREVVFTYEGGRAKWNYVKTELENSGHVTIASGLQKGQRVIVSNNINLAHGTEVTLEN